MTVMNLAALRAFAVSVAFFIFAVLDSTLSILEAFQFTFSVYLYYVHGSLVCEFLRLFYEGMF
jgi:hypothetical protein